MQRNFTRLFFSFIIFWATNPLAMTQTSFSDNFDSYTAGDFLCVSSNKWRTWDNKPGTATDTKIVNDKSASGNNAIKISSTSASGGPTDILLPFGGRYDKGLFILEWKMFIEKGKTGYFNIQGNETPGVLWTLNGYLRDNNVIDLTGSNNARLFTTTYPTDEWFTFSLEINLTSNNWKVLVNGDCQGAFKNTNKFVAGLNLYPTDASSAFYCDDFSFSYNPVAPTIANDVALDNVTWDNIRFSGTEDYFKFRVSNIGEENMLALVLDATFNGAPLALDLSGVELASGESQIITSSQKITLEGGVNTIELSVASVNGNTGDEELCNNFTSLNIEGVTPAVNKAVLIEEATGTWCPWCPRGAVYLDLLSKKYTSTFVPIAVHNNDPMTVTAYDALIRATPGFTGFPSVILNRNTVVDPSASESPFLDRISVPAPAYFVTGAKFDASTRKLDVSITTIFQEDVNTPMWINMILTEDGVKGTGSGYNQANAYAGGAAGPMGGYELLPNPVPASQMVYDHVGRFLTGVQKATDNSLDGPYANGESVVRYFSFTIPQNMNVDKFHLIPVLLSATGFQNAGQSTMAEALSNGYVKADDVLVSESFQAYPNPAQNEFNIDFQVKKTSDVVLELTDITGKVLERKIFSQLNGEYTLPIQTHQWNAGMYMVTIRSNDNIITKKVFVNK